MKDLMQDAIHDAMTKALNNLPESQLQPVRERLALTPYADCNPRIVILTGSLMAAVDDSPTMRKEDTVMSLIDVLKATGIAKTRKDWELSVLPFLADKDPKVKRAALKVMSKAPKGESGISKEEPESIAPTLKIMAAVIFVVIVAGVVLL